MRKIFIIVLSALCSQALPAQNAAGFQHAEQKRNGFIRDSIDHYINKGLQDWNLPGLAIVIIKNGKVVLMKGYGIKDIVSKAPVDTNTLFMIASNTKLFTASSLALLETQGKLALDDHITKYFPDYRLYDSTSTELVSLRDLLSHRIGTKTFQGDFTFWNTSLSRKEIMKRMRLLKPSQHFRQDFGYCNSCFLNGRRSHSRSHRYFLGKLCTNTIVDPLGMRQTMILSTGIAKKPMLPRLIRQPIQEIKPGALRQLE